jgi:hypothetical protein
MHMCIHANIHSCICSAYTYVHSCKHANMHSCIHANMLAYVHKFTSMHAHMRASVHAVMPTYMHDERDVMSGVMRERERASVMQRKNDFTEIILSPLTPDSFALSRSHQTSSFSLSLSPPTNLIPSLLLESRFSLFLSHSLSRHVRFYSNLSSHHILISLSHTHANSHSSPPFLPSSPRIEKMRVVAETVILREIEDSRFLVNSRRTSKRASSKIHYALKYLRVLLCTKNYLVSNFTHKDYICDCLNRDKRYISCRV